MATIQKSSRLVHLPTLVTSLEFLKAAQFLVGILPLAADISPTPSKCLFRLVAGRFIAAAVRHP